jgi:hypothetical protein
MIGGGGGGGVDYDGVGTGGGGAGGLVMRPMFTLQPGTYTVTVGDGGGSEEPGGDTSLSLNGTQLLVAKGGGCVIDAVITYGNGGCGGGASAQYVAPAGTTTQTSQSGDSGANNALGTYYGYGRDGGAKGATGSGGGGGGCSANGGAGTTATSGGLGGNGLSTLTIGSTIYRFTDTFATNTIGVQDGTTETYRIGGGGTAAAVYNASGILVNYGTRGGNGGGGAASSTPGVAANGVNGTGGGGSGVIGSAPGYTPGGLGGSGIVAIRMYSGIQSQFDYVFSLSKLVSTYTGPVVCIAKGAHNATGTNLVDFYGDATGSNLYTGANGTGTELSAWLSGSIGYVRIFYNQGGSTNFISTTSSPTPSNSNLPTITLVTGKWYVSFTGAQLLKYATAETLNDCSFYTAFIPTATPGTSITATPYTSWGTQDSIFYAPVSTTGCGIVVFTNGTTLSAGFGTNITVSATTPQVAGIRSLTAGLNNISKISFVRDTDGTVTGYTSTTAGTPVFNGVGMMTTLNPARLGNGFKGHISTFIMSNYMYTSTDISTWVNAT